MNKLCNILVILFLSAKICQAETFRWLDWDQDKWNSTDGTGIISKYDKIEHAVGFGAIALYDWKIALISSVAWEVKDAFVPYEKYGKLGGDGFSTKDLLADIAGIIVFYHIKKWFVVEF